MLLAHGGLQAIDLLDGVVLQRVAQPRAEIALGVGPADRLRHVVFPDRLIGVQHLARRQELVLPRIHVVDAAGQRVEELEDAGLAPLVLAQRLVVHEQVAHVAVAVDLVHPARELLGGERPFLPVAVAEAERDVVAQAVVLQHQRDGLLARRRAVRRHAIQVVGAAEPEQAIHALADHGTVPAHPRDVSADLVGVDQLGVAEHVGRLAEEALDHRLLDANLLLELAAAEQEAERVMAGLGDELAAARVGKLLEQVDHVRRPLLELLQRHAADRVAHAEAALMAADQIQDLDRGRPVALVRHLAQDALVGRRVEVERIGVEHRVAAQSKGLMHLEVEADCGHGSAV